MTVTPVPDHGTPVQAANAAYDALTADHRAGHRCTDGAWYNRAVRRADTCPVQTSADTLLAAVHLLHRRVHEAAHDTAAAEHVAEGMTGLVMADLPKGDRIGWTLTARMAIETLAQHLDRQD